MVAKGIVRSMSVDTRPSFAVDTMKYTALLVCSMSADRVVSCYCTHNDQDARAEFTRSPKFRNQQLCS